MTSSVSRPDEGRVLHQIISTVGSSLQLSEVLAAVVRLLSEASAVHACFVYIREDGERLVLRSASAPYAHLVGRIVLERGEGLAWWVVEHRRTSFIRDNALADPRVKYELEEEQFQSLISVPIIERDDEVIGVISLHSEAPREFTDEEVEFLVSCSSLVAGAIENARLYEETTRRVAELEELTELGETIARAVALDDLLAAVTEGTLRLLRASACHVYVRAGDREEFRLRGSAPQDARAEAVLELSALASELSSGSRPGTILAPLRADEELIGLLRVEGSSAVSLARSVASQTAVAIKKIELIERLTEKNLIKDFFEQLVGGKLGGNIEERAARLGFELSRPYLVLLATPVGDELEKAITRAVPGSLFDRHEESSELTVWVVTKHEVREAGVQGRMRRRGREGISLRHSRGCRSRGGDRCSPTYQAQVWVPRDGRPIRRTFRSLAEARAWRQETQVAVRRLTVRAPTSVTVQDAATAWLKRASGARAHAGAHPGCRRQAGLSCGSARRGGAGALAVSGRARWRPCAGALVRARRRRAVVEVLAGWPGRA